MNKLPVAAICIFSVLTTSAFAQRDLQDIPVPNPEEERKSFIVADGFEVNLFAADPMLSKPIQMNFDSKGRLWVVSSSVYPHIKPGQKANDKVLVIEDTDQDGTADTTKVFADGLLIPTGIEAGDGGVYVANSTQLLHFSDPNGDGKANKKRVVLSGFGTEDTHHILHTLRWGPDARLYFNQSIYIHSHIETPFGVRRLGGGGIWRFRPENKHLEVFARGFVNAWGHHFDEYGQSFATDGAGFQGINYVVPGASYLTAVGAPRILQGLNPGSPKHCGLEIVNGRHLPDDWQGSLITNDFRGHRVCRFVLSESGSGYVSKQKQELIRTEHVAFRPIDVKMGPDGAIYIADWYNPIIQHGEVDFHDPRRDRTHGRIWRVTAKNRKLVPRTNYQELSPEQLLNSMTQPELWVRTFARREIKNREAEATRLGNRDAFLKEWKQYLDRWVTSFTPVASNIDRPMLEALWTYQALAIPNQELLVRVLNSSDGKIRAAGVRVLSDWHEQIPDNFKLLEKAVTDSHPRVRLEAVRALTNSKNVKAAQTAMLVLNQPMDKFLDYSLWLTVRELSPIWLPEFQKGNLKFDGQPKQLLFAANAVKSQEFVSKLIDSVKDKSLDAGLRSQMMQSIGELGDTNALKSVLETALAKETKSEDSIALLNVLSETTQKRKVRPAGELWKIQSLLSHPNIQVVQAALNCIGVWKMNGMVEKVSAMISDEKQSNDVRQKAIETLGMLDSDDAKNALVSLTQKPNAQEIRRDAIISLVTRRPQMANRSIMPLLKQWEGSTESLAKIFEAYVQRKNGAKLLSNVFKGKTISPEIAKIGLRVVSSSGRPAPELTQALTTAGNITYGPRKLSPAEMKEMVSQVLAKGDAHRGEEIFRRKNLSCLKCHAIGGAGGKVGTDMSSLGGSAQIDYLVESLLDPAAKVKENYHSLVVMNERGKVYTGIQIRKSKEELVLRDAEGREIAIPTDSILRQSQGSSLMPTGLVDKLSEQELFDLIRFLSALGKEQEFAVGSTRYIRTWQSLTETPDAVNRIHRTRHGIVTEDDPVFVWRPDYSKVDGSLPLTGHDILTRGWRSQKIRQQFSFVRSHLEVTEPGELILKFNEIKGLKAWLNSEPLELKKETLVNLEVGIQKLTLSFDPSDQTRADAVKIELVDVQGQPTQVKVISKK